MLVRCCKVDFIRLLYYVLRSIRYSSFLADLAVIFCRIILFNNEKTDKGTYCIAATVEIWVTTRGLVEPGGLKSMESEP